MSDDRTIVEIEFPIIVVGDLIDVSKLWMWLSRMTNGHVDYIGAHMLETDRENVFYSRDMSRKTAADLYIAGKIKKRLYLR